MELTEEEKRERTALWKHETKPCTVLLKMATKTEKEAENKGKT
ncbi:hypothetical protein ACOI1C_14530 [Bacillus sp. DJP31]